MSSPNCSSGNLLSPNRKQHEGDFVQACEMEAEEEESRYSLVKEFASLMFESKQSEEKVIVVCGLR